MDHIFALPLLVLALVQALISLILLAPKAVSLPLAQLIAKNRRSAAVTPVVYTVSITLGGLFVNASLELFRNAGPVQHSSHQGDVYSSIDYLRAQVSWVLTACNLLLLFLNLSLSEEKRQHEAAVLNLEAMKRQAKGLQAEYERVTKGTNQGASATASGTDADLLNKKIDRLIQEKASLQEEADAANKAKSAAEARVEAMVSQMKGFDREFDRILQENKQLQARLSQQGVTGAGMPFQSSTKKDD